jgi:hypothetical protein
MSEWEKERTLARIAKRNQERVAEIEGLAAGDGGGKEL